MDIRDILDGLLDALELERELGVRSVEFDRALLRPVQRTGTSVVPERATDEDVRCPGATGETSVVADNRSSLLPIVFLHDRALSAGGVEMMAKIVTAMHQTPETAPILFTGTRPAARVTVVLGFGALKRWFPGASGSPGQWISPDGLSNVLVTYSPEYILRFGSATPAVKKLKLEMWTSLKAAIQRIAAGRAERTV